MLTFIFLFTKCMAIGILASVPLGPVGVLCIQRTLSKGLMSGFMSGMGAAIADAMFAVVAILGLSVIINFVETQQFLMRLAGGSMLLFLGARIFYSNPIMQIRQSRKGMQGHFRDFLSVLVLMLANPLAVFLFLAAFASLELVSSDPGPLRAGTIVTGVLTGASIYWFVLSSMIYRFRRRFRLRILFRINKSSGVIIAIFGATAILTLLF